MQKNNSSIRTVMHHGKVIEYELTRKKVKNINLRVRGNGTVSVSANKNVPLSTIDGFVSEKAEFILHHLETFAKRQIMQGNAYCPITNEQGDVVYLLGKKLTVKLSDGGERKAFCDDQYLYLNGVKSDDLAQKKKQIEQFFTEQANVVFKEMVERLLPLFSPYGVLMPTLKIRSMKSRWGSCAVQKGIITLNKKLIEAPIYCIEYVVVHEYCHFIHPNHSKDFYAFMSSFLPDWKARKSVLSSFYRGE